MPSHAGVSARGSSLHLDHAVPSAPAISSPIRVDVGLSHRNNVQDPALEDHRDPIRDLEQLLEILADHDDGAAARPELEQLALHELLGRDVQPPGGLRRDQHQGLECQLAGEQRLLQVAARERAGARLRSGSADPELLDLGGDEAPRGAVVQDPKAAEGRFADPRQDHAVGERQRAR